MPPKLCIKLKRDADVMLKSEVESVPKRGHTQPKTGQHLADPNFRPHNLNHTRRKRLSQVQIQASFLCFRYNTCSSKKPWLFHLGLEETT